MNIKQKFIAGGLTCSALMLAIVASVRYSEQQAHADQVVNKGTFSFLTAQISQGEEGLFVLDPSTGGIYIYKHDRPGKNGRVDLKAFARISDIIPQQPQ